METRAMLWLGSIASDPDAASHSDYAQWALEEMASLQSQLASCQRELGELKGEREADLSKWMAPECHDGIWEVSQREPIAGWTLTVFLYGDGLCRATLSKSGERAAVSPMVPSGAIRLLLAAAASGGKEKGE